MDSNKRVYAVNKLGLSRSIPEDVKRQVRQRCGFGCVICGLGVYEYEHFNPEFKKAKTHEAEGITLLCPTHHAKKTRGALSVETVIKANANPKALTKGFANDEFDLRTSDPTIKLGSLTFKRVQVLLQIGDEKILEIIPSANEEEHYMLNATLRNKEGDIILKIKENEWQAPSSNWDCKLVGKRMEIRNAPQQIELVIRHEPPSTIVIERLLMIHDGTRIEAYEGGNVTVTPYMGSTLLTSLEAQLDNFEIGFMIHKDGGMTVGVGPKEGGGKFSSGPNGMKIFG